MAKLQKMLHGEFDAILTAVEDGILKGSISASMEDYSDFQSNGARCSVRVFERYSYSGGNRVSMNVTLFQGAPAQEIYLSAITSGGSTGVFWKFNTFGEENFLDQLKKVLETL